MGMVDAIMSSAQAHCPDWLTEVAAMEELGVKAEIEAVYTSTGSRRLSQILRDELERLD